MRHCAPPHHGAFQPSPHPRWKSLQFHQSRRGFTLLEMCTVLFIIVLLFGAMMPAMHTAFVEQVVRSDSHQLSLLVKTAMLQSADQHRTYVLDLTSTSMSLHPAGHPVTSDTSDELSDGTPPTPNTDDSDSSTNTAPPDIVVANQFDSSNKLLIPNPEKPNTWIPIPPTSWIFEPDALCPATHIRVSRGDSWLEMDFNALTGNVENEATYFP